MHRPGRAVLMLLLLCNVGHGVILLVLLMLMMLGHVLLRLLLLLLLEMMRRMAHAHCRNGVLQRKLRTHVCLLVLLIVAHLGW